MDITNLNKRHEKMLDSGEISCFRAYSGLY